MKSPFIPVEPDLDNIHRKGDLSKNADSSDWEVIIPPPEKILLQEKVAVNPQHFSVINSGAYCINFFSPSAVSGHEVGRVNFVERDYIHMLQKGYNKEDNATSEKTERRVVDKAGTDMISDVEEAPVLIKLGGSVITNKYIPYTYREAVSMRLAKEIRDSGRKVILVHGAGSFGHIMASQFEMHKGFSHRKQISAFAQIHKDVRYLNLNIINNLLYFGLDAISISTSSVVVMNDGKIKSINFEVYRRALDMGLIPVSFGDIVFDEKKVFSICSADVLMLELARHFRPSKSVFVVDTDGVMNGHPKDKDAKLVPKLEKSKYPEIEKKINASVERFRQEIEAGIKSIEPDEDGSEIELAGPDDVTGGLFSKLDYAFQIASLGIPTYLVNGNKEGRLLKMLRGDEVIATEILP